MIAVDVDLEVLSDMRFDHVQELLELRRPVPMMKPRDHLTGLRAERGELRRRSMLHLARLQRQQGLGRSDLRLPVDGKDGRMRGPIE
jgi:hypothetical protein